MNRQFLEDFIHLFKLNVVVTVFCPLNSQYLFNGVMFPLTLLVMGSALAGTSGFDKGGHKSEYFP